VRVAERSGVRLGRPAAGKRDERRSGNREASAHIPRDAEVLHPVAIAGQREDAGGDLLTAAALAADAAFTHVLTERTAVVPG
jgi:hypothetical protein